MADPAAFDHPELGALWTELRRQFEAASDGEVRTVRLSSAQRSVLADLLELVRLPSEPAAVVVARVDEAVRHTPAAGCSRAARSSVHASWVTRTRC